MLKEKEVETEFKELAEETKQIDHYETEDDEDEEENKDKDVSNHERNKSIVNAQWMKSSKSCGTIKKLELIDFMCHRNLEVCLGPNINFITGPNGSGKSVSTLLFFESIF